MATADDLAGVARAIIDGNTYLTLATADADGRPWASPVWFAPDGYDAFLWVSAQDTRHSRNLALRSDVGIAIFDSTVPIGTGQGVYAEAVAACLSGAELERGIAALLAALAGPRRPRLVGRGRRGARRAAPLPRHGDRALDPGQGRGSRRRPRRRSPHRRGPCALTAPARGGHPPPAARRCRTARSARRCRRCRATTWPAASSGSSGCSSPPRRCRWSGRGSARRRSRSGRGWRPSTWCRT